MKNAFEEARTLAKDEKLVAELEKAIAENDLAKVKSLYGEISTDANKGHTYPEFDEQSINFNRFRDKKAHRTEIANAKPGDYLKHKKAKTVEQAIKFSKNGGAAQYLPDVNINALEKLALQKGIVYEFKGLTKNVKYFFYKSDRIIGYDNGIPTQWIRTEISSGFHHSHPINTTRLATYIEF